MNDDLAEEMLELVKLANNPDHEPTVKIDKETFRLVKKWNVGSIRATVKMMCGIADQELERTKQRKREQNRAE